MAVKPNDEIAGYHFAEQIGETDTATVWLARERDTSMLVAIKLLETSRFPPSSVQAIYERLVGAVTDVGRLTHQNLVPVRSTILEPRAGVYGLVSEYVEGLTLDSVQIPHGEGEKPGASDARILAEVLSWFQQLAAVLAWLHTNGVVHGDIKPRNVALLTGWDRPRLALLDLCWANARIEVANPDRGYWSPEQVAGEPPGPACDQFAAAKILHELLIASEPELSAAQALALAPVTLLKVVQRAMHREAPQRFPDMGAFFYAIESVRTQLEDTAARQPGKPSTPPRSWKEKKRDQESTPTVPVSLGRSRAAKKSEPPREGPPERPRERPREGTRDPFFGQDLSGPNSNFAAIGPKPPLKIEAGEPPVDKDFSSANTEPGFARQASKQRRRDGGKEWMHRPLDPNATNLEDVEEVDESTADIGADVGDDEPPKKSVALIVGVSALVLAIAIFIGALLIYSSGSELVIRDPGVAPRDSGVRAAASATGAVAATAGGEAVRAASAAVDAGEASAVVAAPIVPVPIPAAPPDAGEVRAVAAAPDAAAIAETPPREPAEAPPREEGSTAEVASVEASCTKGDSAACIEAAELHSYGRTVPANPSKAATLYERACYGGRLDGCMKAGDLYARSATPKRARTMYEKACDRRVAQGCEQLSRLYRNGIGGPANARTADAFKKRACGLGLKESCR